MRSANDIPEQEKGRVWNKTPLSIMEGIAFLAVKNHRDIWSAQTRMMPGRRAREIAFKPQGTAALYSALWTKLVL
jgi:hypothetical protein